MNRNWYCYRFPRTLNLAEVHATLHLAIVAAESLHGAAQVRLDAVFAFDRRRRRCDIAAGSAVGRDLNRLFAGFVVREFGAAAVRVERGAGLARPWTSA